MCSTLVVEAAANIPAEVTVDGGSVANLTVAVTVSGGIGDETSTDSEVAITAAQGTATGTITATA